MARQGDFMDQHIDLLACEEFDRPEDMGTLTLREAGIWVEPVPPAVTQEDYLDFWRGMVAGVAMRLPLWIVLAVVVLGWASCWHVGPR